LAKSFFEVPEKNRPANDKERSMNAAPEAGLEPAGRFASEPDGSAKNPVRLRK
jgi:hypothetical protein